MDRKWISAAALLLLLCSLLLLLCCCFRFAAAGLGRCTPRDLGHRPLLAVCCVFCCALSAVCLPAVATATAYIGWLRIVRIVLKDTQAFCQRLDGAALLRPQGVHGRD